MGRAYDASRGVVLPSHPPHLLAFGEGHLQPAVTANDDAFDRDFSGHFPNITTADQGGIRACAKSMACLHSGKGDVNDRPSIRQVAVPVVDYPEPTQFDIILLPTFETSDMSRRGVRKLLSKSERSLLTYAHYRFQQFLA